MSNCQNIIAWLVPTARNSPADKATCLSANAFLSVSISSSSHLSSRLSQLSSRPQKAIQLTFAHRPRRRGSFILGTDPNSCDVVLPYLPGVAKQHCAISFDAQSRLILEDISEMGTQVWYGWECSGDQRDYSWVLSSGFENGFPSSARRIAIDIQGVQFQVIVNDHSDDWEGYNQRVDAFGKQTPCIEYINAVWDADAAWDAQQPLIQHVFVKNQADEPLGDVYLWDTSRPWEPMVKASA